MGMNASSASSAGGEGGKKASPILIRETKDKTSFETDRKLAIMVGGKEDDALSPNNPDKSTTMTSSDGPSKEGGAKPSTAPEKPAEAGSKRKEQHDSQASTQGKKPRIEPKEASNETLARAVDDDQTESEDDDSTARAQKSSDASDSDTKQSKKPAAKEDAATILEAKVAASFKEQKDANEVLGSEDPHDEAIRRLEKRARTKVAFPQTLYQLLEDDEYKDACCWLPDGVAFALDPEIFTKKVINVHFPGSKFDSFKRKLNRWGFRRIMESEAPGTMTYYHRLFRHGYPGLIKQMNGGRIVTNKNKSAQAISDERGGALTFPTAELSANQEALLAAMLGGSMPGGLGSLMGGGLPSLMAGGAMQFPMGGGIPAAAPPQQASADGEAMEQILLEQERLRLELAKKNQDELELRQKLNEEILRRKAQEDQMRELLLASSQTGAPANASASSSQGPSPQMPLTELGTAMPSGMFPGMSQFPQQQAAGLSLFPQQQAAGLNLFSQQPGQALAQFLQGQGLGQLPGMMASDPSDPSVSPAPAAAPSTTNELDLARFRNLNEQQEQDFERRVQEELARRQSQG